MFYGGYDAQAAPLAKALKSAGYKGIRMAGNGVKSTVFTDGARLPPVTAGTSPVAARTPPSAPGPRTSPGLQGEVQHAAVDVLPGGLRRHQRLIEAIKTAKEAGEVTRESVAEARRQDSTTRASPPSIKFAAER